MKNTLNKNEKFWIEDPCILITNFCQFNPLVNSTFSYNLNSYTRLIILIIIILFTITKNINYIYIGLFLILIIIVVYYMYKPENFIDVDNLLKKTELPMRKSDFYNTDTPNNNPLKNPTQLDFDTPQKYSKATESDSKMNKYIKDKMFQNGSEWVFDTGARQYFTMPNSSVPNDQGAFANWLYGTEPNCKMGSIYMHRTGTPSESLTCNGMNLSSPTNFGNLNNYSE